jgi:hypothetical protein
MNYLFDTDAVSIFYDAARMPEHLRLKNRVSTLKDEDVLLVSVLTLSNSSTVIGMLPPVNKRVFETPSPKSTTPLLFSHYNRVPLGFTVRSKAFSNNRQAGNPKR